MAGVLAAALTAWAQEGALRTRNHRPLQLIVYRFEPQADVLAKGRQSWSLSLTAANDFRKIGGVDEDAEVHRLLATMRQGMGSGWEWFAELPLMDRSGGFLDPIIDGWHQNVLRWSDPARNATAFGRSRVALTGAYDFGSASGIGDASVGASYAIRRNVVGRVALKLPTGNAAQLLGSGGWDLGIAIDGLWPINRRWDVHAMLAGLVQGRGKAVPGVRSRGDQQTVAFIYKPNSKDRWLAQWSSESAAVRTGVRDADGPHRIASFAYRRIGANGDLELYFSEDKDLLGGILNIGPDFVIGARWTWRF